MSDKKAVQMMGIIKRIKNKLYDIQDEACENCPLGWEDWGAYHEDCDCGCCVDKDNSFCWYACLPMWIRQIIRNRYDKRESDYWEREAKRYEELDYIFGEDDPT